MSADADTVNCPLCAKLLCRNGLGKHLLSNTHADELKELLTAKKDFFIKYPGILPHFTTKAGKMASVCFGCKKGYMTHKPNGGHSCDKQKLAITRFAEFVGEEPQEEALASSLALKKLQEENEELKKKLAAAEKEAADWKEEARLEAEGNNAREPYETFTHMLQDEIESLKGKSIHELIEMVKEQSGHFLDAPATQTKPEPIEPPAPAAPAPPPPRNEIVAAPKPPPLPSFPSDGIPISQMTTEHYNNYMDRLTDRLAAPERSPFSAAAAAYTTPAYQPPDEGRPQLLASTLKKKPVKQPHSRLAY